MSPETTMVTVTCSIPKERLSLFTAVPDSEIELLRPATTMDGAGEVTMPVKSTSVVGTTVSLGVVKISPASVMVWESI